MGVGAGSLLCLLAAASAIMVSVFMNGYFAYVRLGGNIAKLEAGKFLQATVALAIVFMAFDVMKAFTPIFWERSLLAGNYRYTALASVFIFGAISLSGFAADGLLMEQRTGLVTQRQAKNDHKGELELQLKETRQRISAIGLLRPATTIEAELEAQRQHKRWTATKGCTDATKSKNRRFCTSYNRLKAELYKTAALETERNNLATITTKLEKIRAAGGVKVVDPQMQSLSEVTGIGAAKIEFGFLAVVVFMVEFFSTFGIYLALGHGGNKPLSEAATQMSPAVSPPVATSRDTPRNETVVDVQTVEMVDNETKALPPPDLEPQEAVAEHCVARLTLSPDSAVPLSEVFSDYRQWCQEAGKDAMIRTVFTSAMGEVAGHTDAIELNTVKRKRMVQNVAFIKAMKAA